MPSFFSPDAKSRVTAAIKEIESMTSAEVVVSVRHASGSYRHTDYLFGFVFSMAVLALLLFSDREFPIHWFPLYVAIAFAFGALVCANVWTLRRLLTSPKLMRERVHAEACAAFVKLGVSRTSGRNGILVFASVFERRVEVVPDVGVDVAALGEGWTKFTAALEASMGFVADFERFVEALRSLGPLAKAAMPRAADDVNELPDEVDAS
jgi:putative membrane protein